MRGVPPSLRAFLEPYGPELTRRFLAVRKAVLGAAPGAHELIYDAYNAVSCAYSYSERLKEAFCHVTAYPRHVNLGFNRGAELPDPDGLLAGSGARIRHVRIDAAEDLERPALAKLLRAAVRQGRALAPPEPARGASRVAAVTAKKRRPRR